jgi:hypothetical protein
MLWVDYIQQARKFGQYLKRLVQLVSDSRSEESSNDIYTERLQDLMKDASIAIEIDSKTGMTSMVDMSSKSASQATHSGGSTSDSLSQSPKAEDRLSQLEKEVKDEREINVGQLGFSSFEILKEVGAGAFGKILKVKLKANEKILAMKVFSKAFLLKVNQMKFALAECKVLAQLSHPFIITLHYAFQSRQHLYLVLDYCECGDMANLITQRQLLEESEARFYIAEVILAIEYLHSNNILYRDMKPDNILLCKSFKLIHRL